MMQALQLALQVMRHMASCEHPYHAKTLPGELAAAIAAVEAALVSQPEPILWYHPMSGRIRWDGKDLAPSWLPLYPEPPKQVNMSTDEKVRRFLSERKTPVSAKDISDYYLISKSAVRKSLNDLERAAQVVKSKKQGVFLWTWNRDKKPKSVALPVFVRPTSYPHIRGYDD
jgi:hypothetical protein